MSKDNNNKNKDFEQNNLDDVVDFATYKNRKDKENEDINNEIKSEDFEGYSGDINKTLSNKDERIAEKNKELIEQVKKQQQEVKQKKITKKKRHELLILIITIVAFAVGLLATLYFMFWQPDNNTDYLRVSVSMTNASDVFYYTDVTGDKIPIEVDPGDSYNLRIVARNSNDISGDSTDTEWKRIYIRFKIWLEVDGIEHPEFIKVNPNVNQWLRYNKEIEDQYLSPTTQQPIVQQDDGYYYYKGILDKNESVLVINSITFDGTNITEAVGGMNAKLVVQITALDEGLGILVSRGNPDWSNAPQEWLNFMVNNQEYL